MGCGCKQQPQAPAAPKGITPIQIQAVQPEEINYSIEQVIRVKDYLISTNKTETERQFVQDFMIEHAGLVVPSYCDQICLSNVSKKLVEMELKLQNKMSTK